MVSSEHFGHLFTCAATGFAMTDVEGNVIDANASMALMVDRTPSELLDMNLFQLTHPDDQPRDRNLILKLLDNEIPGFVVETRLIRPDASILWVRKSVSLLLDEPTKVPCVVFILEDLSACKRAQDVLEQQEHLAAIGRLTSSIIHEINNPLEAVLNLLYLAQHAKDLNEARPYLENAEKELNRAAEITMQGLQFHRQPSSVTSTNVAEMMETVLALFKARLRTAQVGLEFTREDGPGLMCCPGEIRQIFVNLISNAVDSMHKGGRLRVRLRPSIDWRTGDRGVRITVADTGCGMSQETLRRMCEAFFTTKGADGSGLGLWVTANIVRKHQASMHARSKGQAGSGTVFMLVFPYTGAVGQTSGWQDAA